MPSEWIRLADEFGRLGRIKLKATVQDGEPRIWQEGSDFSLTAARDFRELAEQAGELLAGERHDAAEAWYLYLLLTFPRKFHCEMATEMTDILPDGSRGAVHCVEWPELDNASALSARAARRLSAAEQSSTEQPKQSVEKAVLRGRPRSEAVKARDKRIRELAKEHPDSGPAALFDIAKADHTIQENEQKLGKPLTKDMVSNALKGVKRR